ncbi:MAG: FIVAR domain-containing protein [Bifidobacteriaceae bacterium]|jgi:hypothetical protein|nr:FIVAR domain-containing protein [Bifidobacteriaceae bacterium]
MPNDDDDATRIFDASESATENINSEFHDGNTQETEVIRIPVSHNAVNIDLLQQDTEFIPSEDTIFSSDTLDKSFGATATFGAQSGRASHADDKKSKRIRKIVIIVSILAVLATIATVATIFIINHNTSMQGLKDELSQETAKYDANYTNFNLAYDDANKVLSDVREKDVQNPMLIEDLRTALLDAKPYKIRKTWSTDGNADDLQNSIAEAKDLNTKLIQSTADLQNKAKLVLDSKETKSKQANEQAIASARLTLRDMLTAGRQTLTDSEEYDITEKLVDALNDAINKADALIADEKSPLQALKDSYSTLENARNDVMDAINDYSE